LGYDLVGGIDRGITVPAGTPQSRIEKLAAALDYASKQKGFIDGMTELGFHLVNLGPKEYGEFIEKRKVQYTEILKNGGFLD
jgi:tripartite-type tricarboxylate transporter receptor subunit TctC